MTDDIFKLKPTKSAVIEDDEKFIIYAQNEIMQKIRMLQKNKCMLTAYFDGGKQSVLTSIVDILPSKNMFLLDYGPDEPANKRLISDGHITFKSQLAGVTAKFTVARIQKANYQSQTVLACSIPENILWVQRRDTYRVALPMNTNAFCLVRHNDGKTQQYRIHDISVGGIGIEDTETNPEFSLGSIFKKCEISLPEFGTGIVTLEVRSHLPPSKDNNAQGRRIGCLFVDLRSDVDATIQRYIHSIECQRKKLES